MQLTPGYQSAMSCELFSEGEERVNINIVVSTFETVNGVGSDEFFRLIPVDINNDDQHPRNLNFSGVRIPETGFFEIAIRINSSCSNCCSGAPDGCDDSPLDEFGGTPRWQWVSRRLSSAAPIVQVTPSFTGCTECGCID